MLDYILCVHQSPLHLMSTTKSRRLKASRSIVRDCSLIRGCQQYQLCDYLICLIEKVGFRCLNPSFIFHGYSNQ